jgi:hypothetical protein
MALKFGEFAAAIDNRVRPYGVTRIPEQDRDPEQADWLSPSGDMYALLFHHPEDAHPAHLTFSPVGNQSTGLIRSSYPLILDGNNARTAALTALREFSVELDADVR